MTPLQIACMKVHVNIASMLFNHILEICDSNEEKLAWIANVKEQLPIEIFQHLYYIQA